MSQQSQDQKKSREISATAHEDSKKPIKAVSAREPKTVAEEMRLSPWLIEPVWRTDEKE